MHDVAHAINSNISYEDETLARVHGQCVNPARVNNLISLRPSPRVADGERSGVARTRAIRRFFFVRARAPTGSALLESAEERIGDETRRAGEHGAKVLPRPSKEKKDASYKNPRNCLHPVEQFGGEGGYKLCRWIFTKKKTLFQYTLVRWSA